MVQLCDLKCAPCRGGVEPLKGKDLQEYARQVPDWQVVDEHHLSRTFKFADFAETLEFVNRVGAAAEELGHHPTITFTWGRATVESFTHKIDGLHANDFILAAHVDRLL
ncbi:MAG: 4a-hydroxytetrahydrobiopterin dehydratase [Planctomycetota bacterium]|jgi:4a-hydroxytetrahydrobiopterin dehydratase